MIKMFCDICGKSQQERKIYGISKKQDNMLILTQDHPVGWDPHPEECETHICAECLEKIIPRPERNENKSEDLTEGNEKDE